MKGEFDRLIASVRRELGNDAAELLERWVTEYMMNATTLSHAPYILRGILYTIRTTAGDKSMAAYYATMCLNRMNDYEWRCITL